MNENVAELVNGSGPLVADRTRKRLGSSHAGHQPVVSIAYNSCLYITGKYQRKGQHSLHTLMAKASQDLSVIRAKNP